MKRPNEFLATSGIMLDQLPGYEASVGHIAATAARDFDFLQHLLAPLQNDYPGFRVSFSASDCCHEARCSTTDDYDVHAAKVGFGREIKKCCFVKSYN